MAQHDMNIANQSFPSFRTDLNNALTALNTMHSGTSRPSGATTGTLWLDTTNSGANSLEIKFFDGSDDISFATINTSANTINFIDSTVSTTFTLSGDSGSNQTITSGDTVDIAGGTGIDTVASATDTVTVSVDSTIKKVGKESLWIPAVSMYPNTTNGCADIAQTELSNAPEIKTLDFDKDSDEFAQFAVAFPKSWNEGTVTFQAFFTADSTNTGTTAWAIAGVAIADDGSLNTAFGTAIVATAKAMSGTANDLAVTAESGAITIAGSPSVDEYVFFQIHRDVSADSLTADAKLLGVKLLFTTDAGNDA